MWIVGYGSLMNKKQFDGKKHKLVIVTGWKRVFNKLTSREVWNKHAHGDICKGVLNVVKDPNGDFNAIAFEVTKEGFKDLIAREMHYHTVKVDAYDFKTHEGLGKYIMFVADHTTEKGAMVVSKNIFPIQQYLEVCREGAYSWSKKFGKEFDRTTYIAEISIEYFYSEKMAHYIK